ncbi:MAG: hypothetical protein FWC72_03475 [Oscillospiraceae bacterium]|nr:hypothetical protein [Oscillospiraceae bacterium]
MRRSDHNKLLFIKLVHTAIWCVFVTAILYVLYAGLFDRVNVLVWVCIGLVLVEGVILWFCGGKCPFTLLGYRYTDDPRVGFDIFLPAWLAKYNKLIFASLFVIGFALVLWRVLR